MHPPWALLGAVLLTCVCASLGERNGVNGTIAFRPYRATTEQKASFPYNTYYLAHSFTNEDGVRRNVLIPVKVAANTPAAYNDLQLPLNPTPYIQSAPVRPHAIPYEQSGGVLFRLPHSNHIPVPTPQTYAKNSHISYSFRSPNKQETTKLRHEGSIKLLPVLYNNEHRFKSMGRPYSQKYTATKIQSSNSAAAAAAPYTNKVRFELEDAKVPGYIASLALKPINSATASTHGTSSPNYLGPQLAYPNEPSGLLHYLEREKPRQFAYTTSETPVEYAHDASTESPNPQIEQQQIHYIQETNDLIPTPTPEHYSTTTSQYEFRPTVQSQYLQEVSVPNKGNIQYVTESNEITPNPNVEVSYPQQRIPVSVEDSANILRQTNKLPQNFTPENIDESIRTLALILEKLQQQEKATKVSVNPGVAILKHRPAISHETNKEEDYTDSSSSSTPGRPGVDYPIYSTIPKTQFDCGTQRYKGFFGDPETHCQVWHYCDLNGGQASFLCPNGTIFNQVALTCDWWFNVKCSSTSQLYVLNERLYKYILPINPSFPEDFSGPVVDRYLAAKFKEMEAKNKLKALKALITTPAPEISTAGVEATTATNTL